MALAKAVYISVLFWTILSVILLFAVPGESRKKTSKRFRLRVDSDKGVVDTDSETLVDTKEGNSLETTRTSTRDVTSSSTCGSADCEQQLVDTKGFPLRDVRTGRDIKPTKGKTEGDKGTRKSSNKRKRKNRQRSKSSKGKNRRTKKRKKDRSARTKSKEVSSPRSSEQLGNEDDEPSSLQQTPHRDTSQKLARETEEKLKRLAATRKKRKDQEEPQLKRPSAKNKDINPSAQNDSPESQSDSLDGGRNIRGRRGRSGSGSSKKEEILLTALTNAEQKFERKNLKIKRKLITLKKKTFEHLKELQSVQIDQYVHLFPIERKNQSDSREPRLQLPQIQEINMNVMKKKDKGGSQEEALRKMFQEFKSTPTEIQHFETNSDHNKMVMDDNNNDHLSRFEAEGDSGQPADQDSEVTMKGNNRGANQSADDATVDVEDSKKRRRNRDKKPNASNSGMQNRRNNNKKKQKHRKHKLKSRKESKGQIKGRKRPIKERIKRRRRLMKRWKQQIKGWRRPLKGRRRQTKGRRKQVQSRDKIIKGRSRKMKGVDNQTGNQSKDMENSGTQQSKHKSTRKENTQVKASRNNRENAKSSNDSRVDESVEGMKEDSYMQDSAERHQRHRPRYDRRNGRRGRNYRPSVVERMEQRVSPLLNREYRQLMQHLNTVLRDIYSSMQRVESYYKIVFNGTRYDIMLGTREVYEELAVANEFLYDGVMRATNVTRNIYTKAHKNRAAQMQNRIQDQPPIASAMNVERKNFRPTMNKAHDEQKKLRSHMRKIEMIKMKCRQGESRRQQVAEQLSDQYDRTAIGDLFENIKSTIYRVNGGLSKSSQLSQLQLEKRYITTVNEDVKAAMNILRNSSSVVSEGLTKFRDNYDLYMRFQNEKRDKARTAATHRLQSDSATSVSSSTTRINRLVSRAKRHSIDLKNRVYRIKSLLNTPVERAKLAMKRQNPNLSWVQSKNDMIRLKRLSKEIYELLDLLRVQIGSKTKIRYPNRCSTSLEGSGLASDTDDDEDHDWACSETGSGDGGSGDRVFVSDDEDFIFIGDIEDTSGAQQGSLRQFGSELSEFTSKQLRDSQAIYDEAQHLDRLKSGLQVHWQDIQTNMSKMENFLKLQQVLIIEADDVSRDLKDFKARMERISKQLDSVDSLDLENLVRKAKAASKRAMKRRSGNKVGPPAKVTRVDEEDEIDAKQEETDNTQTEKDDTKKEESEKEETEKENTEKGDKEEERSEVEVTEKGDKFEDDFDYSALFKKGREIRSNRDDILYLKTSALDNCGKIGGHFHNLRGNISLLRQKVDTARQMLSSLELSVSKSGPGHIHVTLPQPQTASPSGSLTTSISVNIKPETLDGTVLVVKGNNSAHYSVTLDGGSVSMAAYNDDEYQLESIELDTVLTTDEWYMLRIERTGQTMSAFAVKQNGEVETKSVTISDLPIHQPLPLGAFVGGAPGDSQFNSDAWEGCIAALTVDGRTLSLYTPDNEGNPPSLCTEHCVVKGEELSAVFDGAGFIHFHRPVRETVTRVTLRFKTMQGSGTLLAVSNKNKRFYLSVLMADGAVRVESSGPLENVVLLSLNNSLHDGQDHFLKILYKGSRTYPELDGNIEAFSVERARPRVQRNLLQGVLIGAFVSEDRQFVSTLSRPLIGCIGDLYVNEDRLLLPDASEIYNAYLGLCKSSSLWHSCWQFTEESKPLSFGVVENSNSISVFVSKEARGPLLYYDKEDKYELEVSLTDEGIDVSTADKEGVLLLPEGATDHFSLITIIDDGVKVVVEAWGQDMEVTYGGFWGFANKDLDVPHTVAIGTSRDEDRMFTGAVSQILIGDKLQDLSSYRSSHKLKACQRTLEEPELPTPQIVEDMDFSCA